MLPVGWRDDPRAAAALARRDIAAVYTYLQCRGIPQRVIAAMTGQSQSEISEILAGRKVVSYAVLARIAEGLGVPRGQMGLAYTATAPSGDGQGGGGPRGVRATWVKRVFVPARIPAPPPDDALSPLRPTVTAEGDIGEFYDGTSPLHVTFWDGVVIRALRLAMRLDIRDFAEVLGVRQALVSTWERRAGRTGHSLQQRHRVALDICLQRATPEVRQRFVLTLGATDATGTEPTRGEGQ